jgi:glycyl-tRNA synthetase
LSYFDENTKERFTPHIVETSAGLGRQFLMFLDDAYQEEQNESGDIRTFLKLHPALAPIKCAVFPLLKNKPDLVAKAREIFLALRTNFMCEFDDNGNVGKRYRRQDEIGTPFCIVVDFDTTGTGENTKSELLNTVTVRDRDTGKQERIAIVDLEKYIQDKIK